MPRSPALVVSGFLVVGLALILNGYRHRLAPDLHIDELVYTNAAQSLATGHGLTVQGAPFFHQPPLFFIMTAPLVWLAPAGSTMVDLVLGLRVVNAVIGALTATGLLVLGWRWRGAWVGWTMAVFFLTDPFIIRVIRRVYLEPLATLWVVLALAVCVDSLERWSWRRRVLAGLLFGGGLLTKELMFFNLAILGILWLRRMIGWREVVTIPLVALATYSLYLGWALAAGLRTELIDIKWLQWERLVGIADHGFFNRPGVSLSQAFVANVGDYWPSYLCIALAVPVTVWCWLRPSPPARFLAAWCAIGLLTFGLLTRYGTINDQFFYFLLTPVLAIIGFVGGEAAQLSWRRLSQAWSRRDGLRLASLTNVGLALVLAGVVVIRPSLGIWEQRFGQETDNGYARISGAIDRYVPRGATLAGPGESEILRYLYPSGEYDITGENRLRYLAARQIHWYVISTKDVEVRNHGVDAELYDRITSHGRELWATDEHTFHHLGLWLVPIPASLVENHAARS